MWIRKKQITEYFKTYGSHTGGKRLTVIVDQFPTGTTNVTVMDEEGTLAFRKEYTSHRGAMVAVGRKYGKTEFIRMVDTLETSRRRFTDIRTERGF